MWSRARSAPWDLLALGVVLLALVLAVAIDHGAAAAHLDRPAERWVVGHRTVAWTTFFRAATHLGDPGTTFVAGLALAGLAALRSVRVGLVLALIALARPPLSDSVKVLVARPRPPLSHLVSAAGAAFPSGHTLAACVLWGAVPAVLTVFGAARRLVLAVQVAAAVIVLAVACSRVYLGVHWVTDVIGGALLGLALLVPLYRLP